MITREQIVTEARTWQHAVGAPAPGQGRDRGGYADLVIGVARALGVVADDFDVQGYGRQPDGTCWTCATCTRSGIGRADMQPGDVVVVAVERDPQHGIVVPYHRRSSIVHRPATPAG